MTWGDHAWELVISMLSWTLAILALAGILALVAYDAHQTRRKGRS